MEIYDDPLFVPARLPAVQAYDRHYRKNAAGKELFLVGGVLFLFLGMVALLTGIVDCFTPHTKPTLWLVAGSLPQFLAGGLGIHYRHYPHRAGLCCLAGIPALAASLCWLFVSGQFYLGACGVAAAFVYAVAWLAGQR